MKITGKKLVPAVLCCLALILALSGCNKKSSSGGAAVQKRPMRIVGPNLSTEHSTIDPVSGKIIPGYDEVQKMAEEAFPEFDIDITAAPWDGLTTKLQTAAASNLVDIMLQGAATTDIVLDLQPILDADPEFKKKAEAELFVPYAMRKADPDNFKSFALTGFVLNLDANLLVYDKKIFDDYGVSYPDENLTQEKLLELAKKLTGKDPVTGKNTYGFYIRASQNSIYRAHLSYIMSKDIQIVEYADKKSDTKFYYDTPAAIEAFRFVNELAKYCPRSFLEDRGIENFGTEDNDVAMFIDGDVPFKYETFKAVGLEDRYGFSYPPKLENGREGWSPYVGDNNVAIARNAISKEDSWAFLKWFITDPGIADWKVRRGQVPNNKAALAAISRNNTYAATLSNMLDKYPKGFSPNTSVYLNTNIGAGLAILNKTLTAMWSGSITPEQAAKQTQAEFIEQVR